MELKIVRVWGDTNSNNITRVELAASATEGEYTASLERDVYLDNGEGKVAVSWDDATEEIVKARIINEIGEKGMKTMAWQLDSKINEQKNPQFMVGLPWKSS